MSYKITQKLLEEKIKKKLEKKFKLKSTEKYDLETRDSSIYRDEEKCENKQIIWLNDEEFIKINYKNVYIWENASEAAQKHNKDEKNRLKDCIFQELENEDKCIIEIIFKKEHILFVVQILIIYLDSCINDDIYYPARINNEILNIRPAIPGQDKEEDSLEGYFVMLDEEKLINTIENNINEEMKIEIILKDWDSFYVIHGFNFSFEYYYFEEYYLYDKELKRINKLDENKNK